MRTELDGETVFVGTGNVDWCADQPTLLLLHGAGMNRTVWVLLARYFARHGYNVVAPDFPAHGASTGRVLGDIDTLADWAWRLVDALRAEGSGETPPLPDGPLIATGHSMGALVALAMAGQRETAVWRLVLLGVGYPMAVGEVLLDAARTDDRAAVDMITIYGHAHASRLGRNTVAGVSVINTAAALIEQTAPGVLHADLAACNAWRGGEQAAAAFGKDRTCIIVGREDRMTPMRATGNLLEPLGARLETLDDCGHMVMSEQPETVLQAMKRALCDESLAR